MTLLAFLARLGNLDFTYVFDERTGCVNGSLAETAEVAIDWAGRTGRPHYVRRGDGTLLGIACPDGKMELPS